MIVLSCKLLRSVIVCVLASAICSGYCFAASMGDYCSVPPYIAQTLPPLLMLDIGRDHKLYYEAYNDAADLDGDGKLDIDYNHSIDYYGYFDSYKCYTYDTGAKQFNPSQKTTSKFCSSDQWSGNVLNWLTMSRMDVLRKVLYGGYRNVDSSASTVLQRAYVPNDAHSWGKELTGKLCSNGTAYTTNCSIDADCNSSYTCTDPTASGKFLVPFPTATTPTTCTATAVTSENTGKVLVANYKHSSSKNCGLANSAALVATYEPANLFAAPSLVNYVDGFEDSSLNPSINHNSTDNYNILAVTSFTADVTGTWQFAVDGDDDVEVQVSDYNSAGAGTIVAQYLGCHGASGGQTHNGSISLTAGNKYTIVARHFEKTGGEGVRVWFKRPACASSAWTYVTSSSTTTGSTSGCKAPLSLFAPNINSGNECAIMDAGFITSGIPQVGKSIVVGTTNNRHHFCSTTAVVDANNTYSKSGSPSSGAPLLRVVTNKPGRVWSWSAKERPECNDLENNPGNNYPFSTDPTDYVVKVSVCNSSMPESNCKAYGSSLKPTGLLHKFGEGDGTKACSKNFTKACTTNMNDSSDCDSGEGFCVFKSPMYFGMMSGSYVNNTQGGVLRKNISSFMEEINQADGTFSGTKGLVQTFNNFQVDTFQRSGEYTCGWITNGPISNGQCNDWGNPLAEIMYETLRYFSGKGTATSSYVSGITDGNDLGLNLPAPTWGYAKGTGTTYLQPYQIFPSCSRPFTLILSDINTSYDSNLPGSAYDPIAEDSNLPKLNLGEPPSTVSGLTSYSSSSLLKAMTNLIGVTESIKGHDWFVGQSDSSNGDTLCTAKSITDLSLVKGICPEEPTKQGTYYLPALAYYGKTQLRTNASIPNMETFSVALASPVADLKIKVGGNYVTIAPTAKSVAGDLNVYANCAAKTTLQYDVQGSGLNLTGKGLVISPSSTAFCPTNQIVNFFVDDIRYDGSDVIFADFRINFEDVEQGADHDMDAIVRYEICTAAAIAKGYGTCGDTNTTPPLASNQFQIKMTSEYAAGSVEQAMGFNLTGTGSTTTDGTYLLVKDVDTSSTAGGTNPLVVASMPTSTSRVFTASGTQSAFLKNPLWYAAKWGGFNDGNLNAIPDLKSEWANNCTQGDSSKCDPDNYFLVVNPLKLETQLDKALSSILKKTSSGTAASIVNNSGEAGTNILQAVFYPQKDFKNTSDSGTKTVSWIGELQNMWYYLDPYLKYNAIREDTVPDKILDMKQDYITTITFDQDEGKTKANRFTNKGEYAGSVELDALSSLWRAGELLYLRDLTDASNKRILYTSTDGASFLNFTDEKRSTLKPFLQASTDDEASKIINWVTGFDTPSDSTLRSRMVEYNGHTASPWRLGDIISSTPKVQPSTPMQGYDIDYNDLTYQKFWRSKNYKSRGMVYVGANDGMLHAFKLGSIVKLTDTSTPTKVAKILPNTAPPLGQEEWAYIPKNSLPYLKYLMQPDYNHLYTVDATSRLIDVSINCSASEYWNCGRTTTLDSSNNLIYNNTSWRTMLIGGMGLGGATRPSNVACNVASDCVKAPIVSPTGYENVGLSSYFALDVTEPTSPSMMWEFSNPALGYTLTPPAIVRINAKHGGTGMTADSPDTAKNGRWFAVFGSGPTGPINTATHQFYGKSDQRLSLFVVDLKTGVVKKTFSPDESVIPYNAFAGSLTSNSALDTDFWNSSASGYYSHDVVYIGYSYYDTTKSRWDGGVLRLVTNESVDPDDWSLTKVIDGVGPVTTAVASLQDRTNKKLWLYFGGGRYFYKDSAAGIDDADPDPLDTDFRRYIFGIQEPCYPKGTGMTAKNAFDASCSDSLSVNSLYDQSDNHVSTLPSGYKGWKIKLSKSNSNVKSERLLTNPSASYNGNVVWTTFMPTSDICGYGGQTYLWDVTGMAGAKPPASTLAGKVILQLSTGAFEVIDLSTALTARENRRTGFGTSSNDVPSGGNTGGASRDSSTVLKPPKGVPRILQIRER